MGFLLGLSILMVFGFIVGFAFKCISDSLLFGGPGYRFQALVAILTLLLPASLLGFWTLVTIEEGGGLIALVPLGWSLPFLWAIGVIIKNNVAYGCRLSRVANKYHPNSPAADRHINS